MLTDFAPKYKQPFFLEKDFYHQVKYLLKENPLSMEIEKKEFKKIVYAPALGDFVISKSEEEFPFFAEKKYALILAQKFSSAIIFLFDSLKKP